MTRPTIYQTFWKQLEDVLGSNGKLALPNVEEVTDPVEGLNHIARASNTLKSEVKVYQMRVQNFDPPRGGVQTNEVTYYPKIFLNGKGMGGSFDGSGAMLVGGYPKSRVFTFFMCDHDWDESGANHNRGWHPKRCKKCGFDASIDSGD